MLAEIEKTAKVAPQSAPSAQRETANPAALDALVGELTDEEQQNVRAEMESLGWRKTTVAEFLALSPDEMALIEVRRVVARAARTQRAEAGLSQAAVAQKMGTSQSRLAFVESNAANVSLDLILRAFFASGGTRTELARVLGG